MARLVPEEGFDLLKDRVQKAVSSLFPIVGKKNTLELHDVTVKDNLDSGDFRSQKEAKLQGKSWDVPLEATVSLKDNATGRVLDKQKIKLLNLPKPTRRFSYIVDGQEKQIDNQWRLKPGVYNRVTDSGELASHFNAPGGGFHLGFNPASHEFSLKYGSSNIPLKPLLHAMGLSEEEVDKRWGKEIAAANHADMPKALAKFYKADTGLKPSATMTPEDMRAHFWQVMDNTKMNPDVNILTLGKAHSNVTGATLLDASDKLLKISRGEAKPDPRDALMFKDLHAMEDFAAERITRGSRDILRKIGNTVDKKDKVRDIIAPDIFNRHIRQMFSKNSLSSPPSQVNPLDMISSQFKTTTMGEGGIKSEHAVSDEAKLIDPSHLGFLDPIETPEGQDTGIILRLPIGVQKRGHDVTIKMYNLHTGKNEDVNPTIAYRSHVVLPDQVRWVGGKPVPIGSSIKISGLGNDIYDGPMKGADYVMSDPMQMFSFASNLIPFMPADHPNRSTMAGRQMEQAVSLLHREAPLVQSLASVHSFNHMLGGLSSHHTYTDGTVAQIKPDAIVIKGADGKRREVQIYDHFPLNEDKAFIHSTPIVKVGDKVTAGQTIADTNFSRNGVLAMGTNLRVGFMPYKGLNYEDGIVVTESAAKKLTSEHLHRRSIDKDIAHVLDKRKFQAYIPTGMNRAQADKLDEEGVIKPGTVVMPGDTLIAALRASNELEKREDVQLSKLHKSIVRPFKDASITWDNDYPGVVKEVVKTGKGVAVHVKTEEPLEIGDKIAGSHGNKGIITRIIPDHESPHTKDGRPLDVILNPLGVTGRTNLGQVLEVAAGKIAEKTGKTYFIKNFKPNADLHAQVTQDLAKHDLTDKETVYDPMNDRPMGDVLVGPMHIFKLHHQVEKKLSARALGYGYAYDRNKIPKGGGPHGAQSLGVLGLYAMLAHGSLANLREMQTLKCFPWGIDVMTDQGPMPIGKIVNQKKQVQVLSWNSTTRQLEYKRVVNYWKRPADHDQLVELEYHARGRRGVFTTHDLRCTPNHKIYQLDGTKVEAKDTAGKCILVPALKPNQYQVDVLVGSLLGDGSLQIHNGPFPAFQERHCQAQQAYLEFKADVLSDFSDRVVKPYDAGYAGFNVGQTMYEWATLAQPEFAKLHSAFYGRGDRGVPDNIEELLTPLALAVWYQDDGSLVHGQRQRLLRLHVGLLSSSDCDCLVDTILKLFGVQFTVRTEETQYNGRPSIQRHLCLGTKEGIDAFLDIVKPYVHSCMSYKVDGAECGQKLAEVIDNSVAEFVLTPVEVHSVRRSKFQQWDGPFLYDIEVEDNHNYFANGVLVGNSDSGQGDQFWAALQAGEMLPTPKPTFAYNKFISLIKGLNVNVEKTGNSLMLSPMTDKQVHEMSNGELKNPSKMTVAKTMKPEPGGLFDQKITGGMEGTFWSHFVLPEAFPNPVFEGAIIKLTGLKTNQYDGLIGGTLAYDPATGKIGDPLKIKGGLVGGKAFDALLGNIDVKRDLVAALEKLQKPTLKGSYLDDVNKKVKFLRVLDKIGVSPQDAYMMRSVPVLPPSMRPLPILPNGTISEEDINGLYKSLHLTASRYAKMSPLIPDEDQSKVELRQEVYDGLRALSGIGTFPHGVRRGILDYIAGKRYVEGVKTGPPKEGFFQEQLVTRKQDMTMRGTIVPEPSLSLDEVGIPKAAALELYKPFVIRELRNLMGITPLQAQEKMKEGGEIVDRALDRVILSRPILLKRDPVLHKYGIQAFKPRIVGGKAVQIHPLVTGGFNADFDGDAMGAFVPVGSEAVAEAHKMFPSNNLFSPATGKLMYSPSGESRLGLYGLTRVGAATKHEFSTIQDVETAVRKGEIKLTDQVKVGGLHSTVGRFMVAGALPEAMRGEYLNSKNSLNASDQEELMSHIAKEHKNEFGLSINKLKDLGNMWATQTAFSIGLKDLAPDREFRDKVLAQADAKVEKLSGPSKDAKAIEIYAKATEELNDHLKAIPEEGNNLMLLHNMGRMKGGTDTVRQIRIAPMLMANHKGEIIPSPIRKSYAEGLDVAGYWTATSGGRKGVIQKVQAVQEPGHITKQVMNSTMNNLILDHDCGTDKGIALSIDEKDILDRYTAADVKLGNRTIKAGALITPELRSAFRNNNVGKVVVRSPLRCLHGPGLCQKSMLPETVVTVRKPGKVCIPHSLSLKALFELVQEPMKSSADNVEIKYPVGWKILDAGKWVKLERVLRHSRERGKSILEIRTTHGRTQHVTCDHTVVVYRPSSCICGSMRISIDKRSPENRAYLFCRDCGRNWTVDRYSWEFTERVEVRADQVQPGDRLRYDPFPTYSGDTPELDPYWLGIYLAEGSTDRHGKYPRSANIAQCDGPWKAGMVSACKLVTRNEVHITSTGIVINDVELIKTLKNVLGSLELCDAKVLPANWLGWSDTYMGDLLAGLLDGDGYVRVKAGHVHEICLGLTSYTLLVQIQDWLSRHGTRADLACRTITPKTGDVVKTRKDCFYLTFSANEHTLSLLYRSQKMRALKPCYGKYDVSKIYTTVLRVKDVSSRIHCGLVYDVTTSSRTFTANGLVTHNCHGLTENGTLPEVGLNVGVLAGQALGERATQLAMKAFHQGGTASSKSALVDQFNQVQDLLLFPKLLPGSATLSTLSGKVTKIEKDMAGGHNVFVEGERHYVPQNRGVPTYDKKHLVVGAEVKKGMPISEGRVNPHEMLPLTGLEPVQALLASNLDDLYKTQGIRRRNHEVVIKALTNLTKIKDPGSSTHFIRGDFAPTTFVASLNRKMAKGEQPIVHEPVLKGVNVLPMEMQEDWMAKLNHEDLAATVIDAAQQGWRSNIHSMHPIPAVVFASELGKPPKDLPGYYY